MAEAVNHPAHYGGAENPYEAIKVIEAWGLSFCLGNTVKYISRADHKGARVEDLKKARWYLDREIGALEKKHAKAGRSRPRIRSSRGSHGKRPIRRSRSTRVVRRGLARRR